MPQASPQVEDGYTRIADEFLEALIAADYPASVIRFVLIVVRETWGWQRKESKIPAKRFADALGVTERRVRQIRDDCLRHNLIEVEAGDQFDTPTYRVQKHYTDWLTWKTGHPWEYKSTRKTGMPTFPEDEYSAFPEDRSADHIKESSTNSQREQARGENEDDERPRPRAESYPPQADPSADTSYLKQNHPCTAQWLFTNCKRWSNKIRDRWLAAIVTAIESASDEWITSDQQAAELLATHPPKGSEENLPSKWLERVEKEAGLQPAPPVNVFAQFDNRTPEQQARIDADAQRAFDKDMAFLKAVK